MFFAQNPTNLAQAQAFLTDRMRAQPDFHWAALIDSAFDKGAEAPESPYPGVNCYEANHLLNDLASVAPWLVPLWPDENGFDRLGKLLAQCSGRPMLSVLASRVPVKELAARWLPLHRVHTADKQRLLLRFADTRVLPGLPSILEPAQWGAIAAPIEHWFYVQRTGTVAACESPAPAPNAAPTALHLTQGQLDAMVEAGEPDAAIDFIADNFAEFFPKGTEPAAIHRYAVDVFRFAKRYQVDAWRDKVELVISDILTRGEILNNPQLEFLLISKDWRPGYLGDAMRGLV